MNKCDLFHHILSRHILGCLSSLCIISLITAPPHGMSHDNHVIICDPNCPSSWPVEPGWTPDPSWTNRIHLFWELTFGTLEQGDWVAISARTCSEQKLVFRKGECWSSIRGSPLDRQMFHLCYEGSQFLLPQLPRFSEVSPPLSGKVTFFAEHWFELWSCS